MPKTVAPTTGESVATQRSASVTLGNAVRTSTRITKVEKIIARLNKLLEPLAEASTIDSIDGLIQHLKDQRAALLSAVSSLDPGTNFHDDDRNQWGHNEAVRYIGQTNGKMDKVLGRMDLS